VKKLPTSMKLLHIYDHTYYQKDGVFYSSGVFAAQVWDTYLAQFDTVTVVANLSSATNIDLSTFDASSRPNVNFLFVEDKRKAGNYFKGYFKDDKKVVDAISTHDVVVVRLPSELGLFAITMARKMNKPFAVEVVGCAWDSYWHHGTLKGKIMAPITFYRMRKALAVAPFAIYVTDFFLQKRYPCPGFIASASNVILPDDAGEDVLQKHLAVIDAPKKRLKIALIGTLNVAYKGHTEALLALKSVSAEIPDFEILFIGKGETEWLQNAIVKTGMQDKATIVGKLPSGKAVFDLLDTLDLYLHPSKHEGLPRVVIEAMSRACPVLASSIAGTPEILGDAYLHEPGDYKKLALQIKDVISDKPKLKQMAAENFERAKAFRFSEIKKKKNNFWLAVKSKITGGTVRKMDKALAG
jgi:glycosyltransferase involved in cell wall biosynthesis